ncbi:MAG: signal peptidase I [Spirochaetales bacterium]|nr:signal peptidase I [Spirochaetales bacterium]
MLDTLALLRNTILEHRKKPYWMAPFILLVLWTLDTVISFFFTGFSGWTWAFTAAMLLRVLVVAVNILFIKRLFILNTKASYRHLKTYSGYFIVFVYVFYNLPRMSLVSDGLISGGRELSLWISSLVSALIPFLLYLCLWYRRTREFWGVYKTKKAQKEEKRQYKKKRTLGEKIWENTDAIISSIITVIIIQHFVFQLYVIPTESMVPTFLVGDRTFVTKFASGPGIPLTDWKLPRITQPKKGDIVVFQSPEYTYASLAKRVFQQFVFYITLTTVDIDRDESGNIRKRFIVKRLTGVPGEKYMMVDDILYVKHAQDADFEPDQQDTAYGHYNLFTEDPDILNRIQNLPVNRPTREILNRWDEVKNTATAGDFLERLKDNHRKLTDISSSLSFSQREAFFSSVKESIQSNLSPMTILTARREQLDAVGVSPFQLANSYEYDDIFFYEYLNGNSADIDALLRDAITAAKDNVNPDLFETSSRKLNLMFKNLQLERFIIYAELVQQNVSLRDFASSAALSENIRQSKELERIYLRYFDFRNFPAFPAGEDEYIPKGHYFLIGDNRYNSLDFRYDHSGSFPRYLDNGDTSSIVYNSSLAPYLLPQENILGIARATFWPFSRAKWHSR